MSRTVKKWFITAASLIIIGLAVFAFAMSLCHWDFKKLNTDKLVTNTYEITEDFNNIIINSSTDRITFAQSDDGICKIESCEYEKSEHSAKVSDGTLTVNKTDSRKWYDHIGFSLSSSEIKIFLPKAEYDALIVKNSAGDIRIPEWVKFNDIDILAGTGNIKLLSAVGNSIKAKTSTGDISIKNSAARKISLFTSTGDITLTDSNCEGDIETKVSTGDVIAQNVHCKNVIWSGSTGNTVLKGVVATGKITVKRSTGDVRFDNSDANEIFVKTSTGGVFGSFCTSKVYITKTSTGDVSVPKSIQGGKCEIQTSTGDIKLKHKTQE